MQEKTRFCASIFIYHTIGLNGGVFRHDFDVPVLFGVGIGRGSTSLFFGIVVVACAVTMITGASLLVESNSASILDSKSSI